MNDYDYKFWEPNKGYEELQAEVFNKANQYKLCEINNYLIYVNTYFQKRKLLFINTYNSDVQLKLLQQCLIRQIRNKPLFHSYQ